MKKTATTTAKTTEIAEPAPVKLMDIDAKVKHMIVTLEGDGDLILNKMNARNERLLLAEDRKSVSERPNVWEDIITAIHWEKPLETENTYEDCNEEMMHKLLKENKPCISAFAFKKSFGDATVRNEIDTYSTKINTAVNVVAVGGLTPIKFGGWSVERRLMSPKKGKPLTVHLNHFHNWSTDIQIDYMDHVFSRDQILNIINLAGFGLGIGSGRTSGYGRYHITNVVEFT